MSARTCRIVALHEFVIANPCRVTGQQQITNRSIAVNVPIEDPQLWNRIVPYLDQALDLGPEQVDIWLDDLQSTQPEIAAMVRALLAERDMLNATGFLATPIVETRLAWRVLGRLLRGRNNPHSPEALQSALETSVVH